jgi:hypothetical protein
MFGSPPGVPGGGITGMRPLPIGGAGVDADRRADHARRFGPLIAQRSAARGFVGARGVHAGVRWAYALIARMREPRRNSLRSDCACAAAMNRVETAATASTMFPARMSCLHDGLDTTSIARLLFRRAWSGAKSPIRHEYSAGPMVMDREGRTKPAGCHDWLPCQSRKVSGRHTCSSERRSAATPQRHSTNAAAIISAAPK